MKRIGVMLLAVVIIVSLCVGFYFVNKNSKRNSNEEKTLTEIQKITTKDLSKNYPPTPREVVKLYNRILMCYYRGECSDEELSQLADKALGLFDEQLLEVNEKNAYIAAVKEDIASYEDADKVMTQMDVCESNDVKYLNDNGDEIAYVDASYFIKDNGDFEKTYQQYVLRKDADGNWKILSFYQIEGDSSEEE